MAWIHRAGVQGEFAQIPNATLRDERLSYAARGALAEILSRPDDWRTCAAAMAARASKVGEGRYGMAAIFRELVGAGYVRYEVTRGPGGRFQTDVHYYDTPRDVSAGQTGSRSTVGRSAGKRPTAAPRTGSPSSGSPAAGTPPPAKPHTDASAGRRSSRRPSTKTENQDRGQSTARTHGSDDQALGELVAVILSGHTRRTIDIEWGMQVARQILAGRDIRSPGPYLRRVIEEDPQRYLPPAPPRRPPRPRPGVASEDKPAAAEADLAGIRKREQR